MLIVIRNSFNILLYSLSGNLVLPHTDFSMPPATTAATNLSILNKHNDEPELRLAHFFCSLALNLSLYSFTDPTTPSYTTAGRQVFFQPNTIRLSTFRPMLSATSAYCLLFLLPANQKSEILSSAIHYSLFLLIPQCISRIGF